MLTHFILLYRHRAGVRPYTSFFNFAKSCVFIKQSLLPFSCYLLNLILNGSSFSQSYRVNLQSSFNIVISITLVFSTNPPVSVFSTVLLIKVFSKDNFRISVYSIIYYFFNYVLFDKITNYNFIWTCYVILLVHYFW